MISLQQGLHYFDKTVSAQDDCRQLRRAMDSLTKAAAQEPDTELDFYAAITPVVELSNLESLRHGGGHKVLLQAYDQQAGSKYRVNEITTALAAGVLLSADEAEIRNLHIHSVLDVKDGLMISYMTRGVRMHDTGKTVVETRAFLTPLNVIVQEDIYANFADWSRNYHRNDKHRALTAAARFMSAAQTVSEHFEDGLVFMTDKMAAAKQELVDDLTANGEEAEPEMLMLYDYDLTDWHVLLTSSMFTYYQLFVQAGDVEQAGYDATSWRNTLFNLYEGGVIESIFDDLMFLIVEQPEDAQPRCHNIISRVMSIRAATGELFETYNRFANAAKAEAAESVH